MQIGFAPSKSAAHRRACLSLYRHLLKRCAEVEALTTQYSKLHSHGRYSPLSGLIRYRFERDKKLKNWQQIRDALQLGRSVLEWIESAATGSSKALDMMRRVITSSLEQFAQRKDTARCIQEENAFQKPLKKLTERKAREAILADKSSYRRQSSTTPVLERPVPYERALKHRDGRRRVPHYFVAQGIPFLRYSRCQPLALGRYIKDQIAEHERLWNSNAQSQQQHQLADFEDEWDLQLEKDLKRQQHRLGETPDGATKWSDTHRALWRTTQEKLSSLDRRKVDYGQQLWNVFLKEEKMAEDENIRRKAHNRNARGEVQNRA